MRLTEKNIVFVKQSVYNGVTYSWFVKTGKYVSDCRDFINCKDGKTVVKDYPLESLPKSVQKFVSKRKAELFSSCGTDDNKFEFYIYRR